LTGGSACPATVCEVKSLSFHVFGFRYVWLFVKLFRLGVGLLAVSGFAADAGLSALLRQVESRYNQAKTLEVLFTESYTPPGKAVRTESGRLMLRKPGRMRWDYAQPKGKLFVSDGKELWLYTPVDNRAEKMKLQASEDMRAPLAFLLGKLNFEKEFRNIQSRPDGGGTRIIAEPSTDNLPYSAVEFLVTPDFHIREVKVTGFDKSTLAFAFDQEKTNPPLDAKLFQFKPPIGAKIVEEGQ
jgi:outer membrane lipoprotein carrier protein